ncbi:MAG: class I SAM-dependent methyltransferase [Planctomycetes bacterium]|nr:class I SAM-dependent methyltransferase [Planctomycetota bacterium]
MSSAEPRRPKKLEAYQAAEYVAEYDQRWASASGAARDARKAATIRRSWQTLTEACGAAPKSVLDLPAGTGRFTALLEELCPGAVLAADLSEAMLGEMRRKHPNAIACVADAARLPFADQSFDVVLCVRFLHLVRNRALRIAFLREFRRVSRLGVIVDYRHGRTLRIWGRHLRHRLGLLPLAPANPSPPAILDELDEAGLQLVRRHSVRFAPLLSDKLLHVTLP